ncbi:OLC1v1013580C1 [Oldenlandia corymbosa var. corymbosa]|uniref:OLC1v1013580C1 n=1 Tax=Oldenlandia corymbosa var. corymbosa TaxID=529605 RepID=A0AAV1E277_OLDCO|nr:OLC1v1013580C1 [Oldenlandia corymbosa var. corymbosa]
MVAITIEITSKEWIKPSSPTPHEKKHHKLSFIDQFQPPIYVPLIFFYPKDDSSSSSSSHQPTRYHLLKQSLSDALTKFNHLAGRITGNLSVHCNDLGALLVEAKVQTALSEAAKNIPVAQLNEFLPIEPYASPNDDEIPLLAVQISSFECGGTAVGVCISHKIADISSLMNFVNYWSALSRGGNSNTSVQPIFDIPSKLFPPVPEDSAFPNYINVEKKLICKRFMFDKERLSELKKHASLDEFYGLEVKNPTRVEALSAFIWKQIINASRAKGETKSVYVASQTVNLRSRMKSLKYDSNLFGNVFVYSLASLTSWPLGNQLHELVWMFRTAIRRINDDYINLVRSGVPYLNAFYKPGGILSNPEEVQVCKFTSWCRLGAYEVDFGWGKPITVSTVAPEIKNGVILLSTKGDEGIEAWITMAEDEMAFLSDELLSLETNSLP